MALSMSDAYDLQCDYFDAHRCRSCSLLELPVEKRRTSKYEAFVKLAKETLGNDTKVRELETPDSVFPSRGRAKLSVSGSIDEPVIGLLDENFDGIELCSCPLHFPEINEVLSGLPRFISEYRLPPYSVKERKGELKGIIVRASTGRETLLLRFVLHSTEAVERLKKAAPEIQATFPRVKVISANIQPVPHQIVEGEEEIVLTEAKFLEEQLGDVTLFFSPKTFSQATPDIAAALYRQAAQHLERIGVRSLLDLYCGVGGFLLHAARFIDEGIGIEVSTESIRAAEQAKRMNTAKHVKFWREDVDEMKFRSRLPKVDAVIVNPPRRGISRKVIDYVREVQPKVLLYSSCNPETLFRDISSLQTDFSVQELKPYDMFPLSPHLEVLGYLQRR